MLHDHLAGKPVPSLSFNPSTLRRLRQKVEPLNRFGGIAQFQAFLCPIESTIAQLRETREVHYSECQSNRNCREILSDDSDADAGWKPRSRSCRLPGTCNDLRGGTSASWPNSSSNPCKDSTRWCFFLDGKGFPEGGSGGGDFVRNRSDLRQGERESCPRKSSRAQLHRWMRISKQYELKSANFRKIWYNQIEKEFIHLTASEGSVKRRFLFTHRPSRHRISRMFDSRPDDLRGCTGAIPCDLASVHLIHPFPLSSQRSREPSSRRDPPGLFGNRERSVRMPPDRPSNGPSHPSGPCSIANEVKQAQLLLPAR